MPQSRANLSPRSTVCQTQNTVRIRSNVVQVIMCLFELTFTAPIQRRYESVRRQWNMQEKEDFVEVNRQLSVQWKYRARRKRASILILISTNVIIH